MKRTAAVVLLALAAWFAPVAARAQVVQFESPKSDFVERQTPGQVWVLLAQPAAARVTVPFAVIGGSATRGATPDGETDFILADGTVTFEPGEVEKTIDLVVVDDSRTEPVETVLILLGTPSAGTLGARSVHTYSIFDDDRQEDEQVQPPPPPPNREPPPPPPPQPPPPSLVGFVSPQTSARENAGTGSLLVRRAGPARAVSVNYRVTGGTATSGDDFVLAAGVVQIPANQESASIVVTLQDDQRDESDETVTVLLENPSAGIALGTASTTLRIIDDDVVDVAFAAAASAVGENGPVARVEIRLTGESASEVSVLLVAGGTATGGGIDYSLGVAPVRIAAGQASATVDIPVADDDEVEGSETAELTLVSPTGARLGSVTRHTLTIQDNDRVLPIVRFDRASSDALEAVASRRFDVILESESTDPVTVAFARTGGTADAGDYTLADGTVTFNPGETRKSITLTAADDLTEEADETIELTLSSPVNARLEELTRHVHWILDDDAAGEDLVFYRQEILTADASRRLVLVGSKTSSVSVAGLAIDPNGNLYISDRGTGPNTGSILMVPKGRRNVLRIMTGLNRPADVELTPDARGIVVSTTEGEVFQRAFGLSVRLTGVGSLGPSTRVSAQTDTGMTRPVNVSADGYFHLPGILSDGQRSDTVTIVVEHQGRTRTYADVPLGSPGAPAGDDADTDTDADTESPQAPRAVGHTVIQLEAPQGQ